MKRKKRKRKVIYLGELELGRRSAGTRRTGSSGRWTSPKWWTRTRLRSSCARRADGHDGAEDWRDDGDDAGSPARTTSSDQSSIPKPRKNRSNYSFLLQRCLLRCCCWLRLASCVWCRRWTIAATIRCWWTPSAAGNWPTTGPVCPPSSPNRLPWCPGLSNAPIRQWWKLFFSLFFKEFTRSSTLY